MSPIEKDDLFILAERYVMDTDTSVFLTGKAGTGKTTFLKYIQEQCPKRHVVLAPTGVAAINAGGTTIHSFFQLPLCPYLPDVPELLTEYQMQKGRSTLHKDRIKIIRTLELLVIDEISMVRADLLDAVDMMLRRYRHSSRPFGGVQLLLIGDAQQLSPVVKEEECEFMNRVYASPFFFESKAFRKTSHVTIELKKVYRQKDALFLDILNAIRENRADRQILQLLNKRVGAPCAGAGAGKSEPIHLMTHNRQAVQYNTNRLNALPGRPAHFTAAIDGEFPESSYPAEADICLKRGAQVMFIRNDTDGQYYNGKLATVIDVRPEEYVSVCDTEGNFLDVYPVAWENVRYTLDEVSGEIVQSVVGVFHQIPLRTAWAITIHKSQGLTFDNVIIDAGAAFAFGQVYVALSRCRTLEGISLERPIYPSVILTDASVAGFNASLPTTESVRSQLPGDMNRYRVQCITSIFRFDDTIHCLDTLRELWASNLKKVYKEEALSLNRMLDTLCREAEVTLKFEKQIHLCLTENKEDFLQERLAKAAAYFLPRLLPVREECRRILKLEIDNREVRMKIRTAGDECLLRLEIHCRSMAHIRDHGFSVEACNRLRTACLLGEKVPEMPKGKSPKEPRKEEPPLPVNNILKNMLFSWRTQRSEADGVPAYIVLHQSTLMSIAAAMPRDEFQLKAIKGVGKAKLEKYGQEILAICRAASKL